ncbi:MAG TPA: hypothetical protein PLY70_06970 [Saprospiraceae bacterium]|nr:hypothetical protein [Saprospiraceae bacterium]HPN70019.1 hypothetical protein [Saprospiraceae bacterium]
MKKLVLSLVAILAIVNMTFAQKNLDKGTIKMELTEITATDPQMAMQLEMMKGSSTEIKFGDGVQATTADMMGGMVKMKTYSNPKEDKYDMLMDMMGQKMWISSTISEMAKDPQQDAIKKSAVITPDKKATKDILGYKCYKISVTSPELAEMEVEAYVTEEIKGGQGLIQGFQTVEMPGFPLEFTIKNAMMNITMQATAISDEVDMSKAVPNTTGYKKYTMEEFRKQMGGMGMGF